MNCPICTRTFEDEGEVELNVGGNAFILCEACYVGLDQAMSNYEALLTPSMLQALDKAASE